MNLRKGGGEPNASGNVAEAVLDVKGKTKRFRVTGAKEFQRLAAVAKLVLVLPHSNADAEVVGLNKTKNRNSLALDGTLSSIMAIKMADLEPCFRWEPPSVVIKASKKATGQYNLAHKS
ncbi:hypothetical protein EYF80_012336 [Liparis tanakae]|uniref:Uncharacterized protein n=1 Tax=Liparis tanakae TaxID=230148 RepID=A0A4Z2IJS8_9TELE|nr:hypothetical protein EYF80_012336 [Liparis tanakae]